MASVSVEISARDQNVAAVLRGVNQALGESAEGMKTSFRGMGEHADGLFGKLKDLRGETRQHERVFAFYGKQLAEVAGIAKGLGTEIAGLGIALGSGMWTVAAVEGLRMIIGYLKESSEEAKKLNEEKLKDFAKSVGEIESAARSAHDALLRLKGEDPERIRLAQQYLAILREQDAIRKKYENEGLNPAEIKHYEEVQAKAREAKKALNEYTEAKREAGAIKEEQQAQKDADRERLEAQKEYYRMLGQVGPAAAKAAAERAAAERQAALDATAEIRDQVQLEQDLAAGEAIYEKQKEAEKRRAMEETAREAKRLADQQERQIQQSTGRMVSTVTGGFVKMAQGEMSFANFTKSIFQQIESMALQSIDAWLTAQITAAITGKAANQAKAISEVSENAAVAGAGAAASQASIPVVGPALAAAAMAETSALVLSSMGPLASAAGGWYRVPHDQIALHHANEQVLPADYAEGLRQLIAGGGRGGAFAGATIIAADAKSFADQLDDQGSALNRQARRWQRRGRVSR